MKYLYYRNFISMLDNLEGIKIFKNFYIQDNDEKIIDILQNGNLSCAVFVSSILYINHLISSQHSTVDSTIKDLLNNNWIISNVNNLKKGDILVWEETKNQEDKTMHKHIGFFIDKDIALSNDYKIGYPKFHEINLNNRKIIQCLKYINNENI